MAVPVLVSVEIVQQSQYGYGIVWRAALPSVVPPGTTVTILRSYAEPSGFTAIATVPIDTGIFLDSDHSDASKNLDVFYKLRVDTPTEFREFGPYHLEDRPDIHARFMIRNIRDMLRNIGATPVLIYQEAHGAGISRCPECWDQVTQQVIASNCVTCGGSSFVGPVKGYYAPVATLIDIQPATKVTNIEDTAQTPRIAQGRMSNYPRLRTGDVMREINTGRLWKVVRVTPVQKDQRALISQDPVILREAAHGEIEYDLPVPSTITPLLRRRNAQRERVFREVDGVPGMVEVWV